MSNRTFLIIVIILLSLVDVILPVPIIGILLLLVIVFRPAWARDWLSAPGEEGRERGKNHSKPDRPGGEG